MIKNKLLTSQIIGSKLFYNLYYAKNSYNDSFNIICNISGSVKLKYKV